MLLGILSACGKNTAEKTDADAVAGQAEPSHVSQEDGEVGISLDSATVARIQLKTEAIKALSRGDETDLPAMVVPDPEATSSIRAGVSGRLAAIAGIGWPHFGSRLQAGDSIAIVGDARPLLVPRSGTVSRVLVQPGELVQAGQELIELTSYDAPLIQVAWSPSSGEPPASLEFSSAARDRSRVSGVLTGPAAEADPVTRDPAWLYRVAGGWKGMRPGAGVTAHVTDGRVRKGVLIPSSAVVQWDALAWVFQEREPGRYVRVRVPTDHPVPEGWLAGEPFHPGDRVVVCGAGQLLSEEFRARIVVGEEVGE